MTEKTRSSSAVFIALGLLVAIVALGAGLVGGRKEVTQIDTFDFVPGEHSIGAGVVLLKMQRGGFSAFGITFTQPDSYVQVTFTLPDSCEIADAGPWQAGTGDCAGPPGLVGSVAGGGSTATGDSIVTVEVTVDAACYEAIELGMDWPPSVPGCVPNP